MSLHTLAHHLQSAGRGDDKVLVHMTPGEVKGLQSLAMAHGGSLTINPHTGLPEAGFLSSILPMVAGAALTAFSGGALSPLASAMIVGAGGTAITGSLGKGLMMGLGAYGGAGLGAGLSSMGTAAPTTALTQAPTVAPEVAGIANAGTTAGATTAGVPTTVFQPPAAIQGGAIGTPTITPTVAPELTAPGGPLYQPVQSQMGLASQTFQPNAVGAFNAVPNTGYVPTGPGTTLPTADAYSGTVQTSGLHPEAYAPKPTFDITGTTKAAVANTPTLTPINPASPNATYMDAGSYTTTPAPEQSAMDKLGAGFKKSTESWQGLKDMYAAASEAAPYGGAASLGSMAMGRYYDQKEAAEEAARNAGKRNQGMIRPYEFDYNATGADVTPYSGSGERRYFEPQFTALTPYKAPGPEYKAEGGLASFAVGGPVEQMSAQNAISGNNMYPQAGLQTAMYSNPMMQRPVAQNVIAPSGDIDVDPYTGEQRFAAGGQTDMSTGFVTKAAGQETSPGYKYSYDPNTLQFTQLSKPVETTPTTTASQYGAVGRTKPTWESQPTNVTSGGMAPSIYTPPALAAYSGSLAPNINIPAYQTPEQQLGLTGFYPMMEQRLASIGSQMPQANYAAGGGVSNLRAAPMNKKMTAVDQARAKMQTQQGLLATQKAARDGDYASQLALQQTGTNPNDFNQFAMGGLSGLGSYSDGGRLLKGPGDGVSDSIPAVIGRGQPARLADGEFVVPARIVSEIGNGSTEAGAKKLYAMMDRVQRARGKTVGKNQVARNTKAEKLLPA